MRAETVTAVAATVAAIAAVVIAAWDNVQTREHNRLSVAPRLTVDMSRFNSEYTITIRNDGIGPAIVRDMRLRLGPSGEAEGEAIVDSTWAAIVSRFTEAGHPVSQTWLFRSGDAIGVDGSYTLLAASDGRSDGKAPGGPSIGALIARLGVAVDYESIYGDALRSTYNWPE